MRFGELTGSRPDADTLAAQGLKGRELRLPPSRPGGPSQTSSFLELRDEKNLVVRCLGGYLGKVLQGDFGPSFKNKDFTVNELIAAGAPVSLTLGLSAITVALFIGMSLGIVAALNQNRSGDYSIMTAAMVGITIPTFVTAPLLTLFLGVYAGLLPVGGWEGGRLENIILPITVLALPQIAIISRLTRGSMIEVMRSNYVRTARAKGLSEFTVVTRHALRSALLPLVSYLGPAIAGLVTGSLVVEQIFQLPGIGRYFINGALNRDYTLVMGVVILYATLVILLNLLADVIYRLLDPKVRYE
ncbi:MAG: ABC transporter permease subunit [Alphaproteobacteria bacterium]|nr:ABC transporter permease subunit [Alphaproteobacteria bacterium]